MCYDIKVSVETQLKRAKRKGDKSAVEEIMDRLIPLTDLPLHHSMGFNHPTVLIYPDRSPDFPEVATWGLLPHWIHDTVLSTLVGKPYLRKTLFGIQQNMHGVLFMWTAFMNTIIITKKSIPFTSIEKIKNR